MNSSMAGKICVIAGATQGSGAAIARRLWRRAGAAGVAVTGRNVARSEAVSHPISAEHGTAAMLIHADLGSVEDCRRVTADTDRRFGRVEVLANAGAMTNRGMILNTPPELFDRMFAVNVGGPFFLMTEAIKLMVRGSVEGAICSIGSM